MSDYTPEHRAEDTEEPVVGDAPPKDNVLLSNSAYEKLKQSSLYVLPALAALYFGIAQIWGLPKAEEVVGTVAVLETFLGVLLGVSNRQYENSDAKYDGSIDVAPDVSPDGDPITNLGFSLDPEGVATKDEIVLKINRK